MNQVLIVRVDIKVVTPPQWGVSVVQFLVVRVDIEVVTPQNGVCQWFSSWLSEWI